MPIPTTDEMVLPVLQHIADGQEYRRLSILDMLTEHFSLTQDERARLSKSGQMEKYLSRKGYINQASKWHYHITALGREFLNLSLEESSAPDLHTEAGVSPSVVNSAENNGLADDSRLPDKSIEENYHTIQEKLAADLLERIKNNTPTFFEKLVIDLLVKMGYGGSREDAGRAVGRSGDGGIDGIINEDRLGLDMIYVQAKRWQSSVSEPPVRDFVGALDGEGVQKGVFITTSNFNPAARNFAERTSKRIILIDGKQLTQLMIEHNVGVSVEKTYEIKRVDSDYFSENTENS